MNSGVQGEDAPAKGAPFVKNGWIVEIVVTLISAGVIFLCGLWLYLDFFSKGAGSGRVVGRMTFHQGDNARRPAGRVTWGRLVTGDPLYRNDTVRTADASEALLDLNDGTGVEMDPLSMIVLNVHEDIREIEVSSGSVLIRTGRASRWRLKDRDAPLPPNRSLRISRGSDGALIERSLFGALEADGSARENPDTDSDEVGPLPLSPPENRRFFTESAGTNGEQRIDFRWRAREGSKEHRLVVARDRSFSFVAGEQSVTGDSGAMRLGPGVYYWRVREETGRAGPVARFSVIRRQSPRLIAPGPGGRIQAAASKAPVVFAWRGPAGASYRLEVARDPDFQGQVLRRQVHRTGITLPFAPGTYYWRLTALGYFPESRALSEVRGFNVVASDSLLAGEAEAKSADIAGGPEAEASAKAEATAGKGEIPAAENGALAGGEPDEPGAKAKKIAPPLPIFPEFLMPLDMATRESIPFRWSPVQGATYYLFRLYHVEGGKAPVFGLRTARPYLNFTHLQLLDEGEFLWTVDAYVPGAPGNSFVRGYGRFHILLSERPERPELEVE